MELFLQSLVNLEDAIAEIRSAADMLEVSIQQTRKKIDSGLPVLELLRTPGTESRETTLEALNTMHSALMLSRAEWYRVLIEQEGMSLSEIARVTGHPRQIIKRRYDALCGKRLEMSADEA
jgi:hypothetical protein